MGVSGFDGANRPPVFYSTLVVRKTHRDNSSTCIDERTGRVTDTITHQHIDVAAIEAFINPNADITKVRDVTIKIVRHRRL